MTCLKLCTCFRCGETGVVEEKKNELPTIPKSVSTEDLEKDLSVKNNLYFKSENSMSLGDAFRFNVRYNSLKETAELSEDEHGEFLWLKVRNWEMNLFRPIYLTGPFSFYVDITPHNYDMKKKFSEPIQYNNDIKPGVAFKAKLYINENSLVENGIHSWTVDIISQITLTTGVTIKFILLIGPDYKLLKKALYEGDCINDNVLNVDKLDTEKLCNKPPKYPNKPVHLVLITHGIFSNIGADMLYLRDSIQNKVKDNDNANMIVRGFQGNIGKSDKGIKYLGRRVGDYLLELYDKSGYNINRISFIGHSLGGPVQAYAIYHITLLRPDFFQKVIPMNLITLACPMLGVLSELPKAVSLVLDFGVLGKTGKDLILAHKFPTIIKLRKYDHGKTEEHKKISLKPILEQILGKSAHNVFESFTRRTTYANAVNDGIVPLGTSALLYLDWRSLGQVSIFKKNKNLPKPKFRPNDELGRETPLYTPPENSTPLATPIERSNIHSPILKNISATFNSINTPTLTSFKEKKKRNRVKKYLRTQTHTQLSKEIPTSPTDGLRDHGPVDIVSSDLENDEVPDNELNIPPVPSTILSAANAVLSPTPKPEYLIDPGERPETIFHDKIYKFSDLPEPHYLKGKNPLEYKSRIKTLFKHNSKKILQEKLARSWHWKMDWRKVLVTLKPDAHNNIIVRRKYVNAWGWGVIEHLVDNHFSEEALLKDDEIFKGKMNHTKEKK